MPEALQPAPPACRACGRVIPDDAPGEVCPSCLATALLTEGGTRHDSSAPPVSSLEGFELRGKIGEGGFGSVYAAEQLHPVRRRVAIKILKPGENSEQALARFEAERQALALMEHPNISRVFHAGETDEGSPFFVMELIDGVPLTTYCRDNALALPDRLALLRDVCDAIAHAHRRGIIHRDIKPSNILVAIKDGKPIPKVIDFGIAKATEDFLTERTLVTQNNQLLGTPAYMSPEQAAGNTIGIDIRADLYSLGILLYELITGEPPFPVTELSALPYDEALRTIRTVDPPRPSARLRQGGKQLPPAPTDLDAIVMKAIEKDPERRYETAGALERDLAHYLAGEAVLARPASAAYRLNKFVGKHRALVAAGAMVALSLVAGTIVSLLLFAQARTSAQRAVENEIRGKERFSQADFTQATAFLDDDRPGLAVAHLARAVRTDPSNRAAQIRLLETLATENWPVPAVPPLPIGGRAGSIVYSGDGSRLFTSRGLNEIAVWDPATGAALQRLEFEDVTGSVTMSPDGQQFAVTVPRLGKIYLWDSSSYELLATLKCPSGRGSNIRFSPDGKLLVSGHDNGHTHLWDLETRKLRKCIPQEGDYVRALFSPDGSRLATYNSRHIQLWTLEGEPLFEKPLTHDDNLHGVGFTSDGTRLVSWSADRTVRVWDLTTGGPAIAILRHAGAVHRVALSPDGSRLVTASEDGFVRLWDLKKGSLVGAPRPHDGPVTCVAFSPDGSRFASGSIIGRIGDGAVKVWDARTGELILSPIYHPRGANQVAFHPNGQQLAVTSRHDEISVWDLRARAMAPLRIPHRQTIWRAIFDDDDQQVVTLTLGGEARAWDAVSGKLLESGSSTGSLATRAHASAGPSLRSGFRQGRFYGQQHWSLPSFDQLVAAPHREGGVQAAAASDDGQLLLTGCRDGKIRIWSLQRGERLGPPLELGTPVTAVAIDAAASKLAAGGESGAVRVFDLATGDALATLEHHTKPVLALSFSPDGSALASGSADHTARLWWGTSTSPVLNHEGDVTQLSFSADGNFLATGSRDNSVRIWQADTGDAVAGPLRHIDTASQPGLFALWNSDNTRLITTGSHDDTARAWDPETGRKLAKPMLQPSCPLSAALGPSGETLLLGGDYDFQTRIWDPASGEPLGPFLKHDERILSCAFSKNGQRYVIGTRAGSVYVRDFPDFAESLSPEALAFAEALGGFRFDDRGILEQVPVSHWQASRTRLLQSTATSPLATWMRWLAADPAERAPSPFQKSQL